MRIYPDRTAWRRLPRKEQVLGLLQQPDETGSAGRLVDHAGHGYLLPPRRMAVGVGIPLDELPTGELLEEEHYYFQGL